MALLTWRFIQAGIRILRGEIWTIIAAHEVDDAPAPNSAEKGA